MNADRLVPAPPGDAWRDELADLIAKAPVNLVSADDRPHVRGRHVDEAVAVGLRLAIRAGERWVDLGTGGGLPGLVLAAMYPDARWLLIDARAKKVRQVAHFAAVLGLDNVSVRHGRAEEITATADTVIADGIISRAVGSIEQTAVWSRGFVDHGQIIAIRGPAAPMEAERLRDMEHDLALTVEAVERIDATMRPTWLIRMRGGGRVQRTIDRARRRRVDLRLEE